MAAAHTERTNNDSKKGIIHSFMLYKYAELLANIFTQQYLDKISVIGVDPLVIPQQKLSSDCLPPVEACDLLSYLVLETSFYTNSQLKNFRSLETYHQLVSGFITSILGQIICDKHVFVAKVKRMNDPRARTALIANKDGTIISAHCAGCIAGLGECCSHVAELFLYGKNSMRNQLVHMLNVHGSYPLQSNKWIIQR